MRAALVTLLAAAPWAALACGSKSLDASDAGADASEEPFHPPRHLDASDDAAEQDADTYEAQAPHCTRADDDAGPPAAFDAGGDALPAVTSLPQVVNAGGTVLATPTLVSVTFAGDPSADELDDFVASVGCTPYWDAVAADYGVGHAVAAPAVRLTAAAPATLDDTTIRSWLAQKIESHDPQFPSPAPDTVYVLWYPAATKITLQGATSCQQFGGYHEGTALADGSTIAYAVVPRCGQAGGGFTGVQELTAVASHELLEACTDPRPDSAPAYEVTDGNHMGWILALGAEVGDMCELQQDSFFLPPGFPWAVQRIWSDRAAAAGLNPCVPADSPAYFYAAPLVSDTMMLDVTGAPQSIAVVHVPVGSSATLPVQLVGTPDVGAFQVQAVDAAQVTQGGAPHLALSLDQPGGKPGDTLHLTIAKQSGDSAVGAEAFALISRSGQKQTYFWGITSD